MMSNVLSASDLIDKHRTLADSICARVGKRNIADWCFSLERHLKLSSGIFLCQHIKKVHIVDIKKSGVRFTFSHPHAIYDNKGDISRWFIHCVEFIFLGEHCIWDDAPPFSLDAVNETQDTIIKKLSDNFTVIREFDFIQSFFMDDGKVVGIQWNHNKKGIEKLLSLI
ncbi:hypothetical protein BKN84_22395 [Salmonella enterica]|nr:hypothetical protein [Salmonella enterica]